MPDTTSFPTPTQAGDDLARSKQVPTRSPDYALNEDVLISANLPDEAIYVNTTAALVWALSEGELTVGEIVELVSEAFPGQADQIRCDVLAALDRLAEHGVIRLTAGPGHD